jgi:hypothetical protein
MINEENIEAYLLDYQEGNLSNEEMLAVETYVLLHPEFAADILEDPIVVDDSVIFENKEALKKETFIKPEIFAELNEKTEELFIVAKIENELTANEEVHFNNAIQSDANFDKEYSLYNKTLLVPNTSIEFNEKSNLKHLAIQPRVIPFRRIATYAAAASLLFIVGYSIYQSQETIGTTTTLNSQTKKTIKKNKKTTILPTEQVVPEKAVFAVFKASPIKIKSTSTDTIELTAPEIIEAPIYTSNIVEPKDSIENNNEPENTIAQNPINSTLENSTIAKVDGTITVKKYFSQKVNEFIFGKKNPSEEEKYASISQRISSASGISFSFGKRNAKKGFHLKIGKLSIDRKKH